MMTKEQLEGYIIGLETYPQWSKEEIKGILQAARDSLEKLSEKTLCTASIPATTILVASLASLDRSCNSKYVAIR